MPQIFKGTTMKKRQKMHLRCVIIALTVAVVGCAIFPQLTRTLKQERIALDEMEIWLEVRWENLLGGNKIDEIRKTAEDSEGTLTVQLWEITAGGQKNVDIVVWRRTVGGKARLVHAQWMDAERSNNLSDLAFRDGFFWYLYGVSSERDKLFGPDKVFDLL